MAQLNITLNQEEIQQLLTNDRNEAFKKLLQESLIRGTAPCGTLRTLRGTN